MTHYLVRGLLGLILLAGFVSLPRDDDEPTLAEIHAVHAAYVEAKRQGFSEQALVALYGLPKAAKAVKKLIDAHQSNPTLSIPPSDSTAIEATRERMNLAVLEVLARITGGSVEVVDFGKQNGARSDKDQTIYAVDGKRFYTATEMKAMYERHFRRTYGIELRAMDMALFDGDASIPDWRRTDLSFEEHVRRYDQGQAKLEENTEAYREAGAYRSQVDAGTASKGRVTLVCVDPDTGAARIEKGSAREISTRYAEWSADVPYRNAMDAAIENKGKFEHTGDFIDRMKFFNRTAGNGVNALALEDFDVDYIFHLRDLQPGERRAFVERMVRDVFVVDASPDEIRLFTFIVETAARVEIDKMNGETRDFGEYLKPLVGEVQREAAAKGETLTPAEVTARARERFHGYQRQMMDRTIVLTTRQKILRDLDPAHLARVAARHGPEQAKKLRWETARQIQRAFEKIEDPKLADRLVSEAPPELRAEIEALREIARVRRLRDRSLPTKRPVQSDPERARTQGPEEALLGVREESFLERRRAEAQELADRVKGQWQDFDADLRAGLYSDAFVTERVRNSVLESLGYEERVVFEGLEVEFQRQFSSSRLLSNVVNLGNASSAISVIRVWQTTGDLRQVATTALWEIVSNVPGVSQVATLRQSYDNGDYQTLSWLFIAWALPGAGQAKLAFDVASGSMEILYDHAMQPLEDDRFSQVYMGFVDQQPAGWSPFVPGWKERREAASRSILAFVPGETMTQKRVNLYAFFQAKLHQRLVANGHDPTTQEYWDLRDQVLPSFFRKYVSDWFAAEGDWHENTTAGLYALGQQEELKERLVQRLLADFEQSEINDRLAQIAKEQMDSAMQQAERQVGESLQVERQMLATEAFVQERTQQHFEELLTRVGETAAAAVDPRISVEVYPSTVLEGQQATIAVRTASGRQDAEGSAGHVIEVRPLGAAALVAGETPGRERVLEAVGTADEVLVAPLLAAPAANAELHVTRHDLEVVVKDREGRTIGTKNVSVRVAGIHSAEVETDADLAVKLRVTHYEGEGFGRKSADRWEDPTPELANPSRYRPGYGDEGLVWPHLWVRWPEMPEARMTAYRLHVTGGVPRMDAQAADRIMGWERFGLPPGASAARGNAFTIPVPMQECTAGALAIEGELLAFGEHVRKEDLATATPLARRPFQATLTWHEPPREVTGRASMTNFGLLSGSIQVKWSQRGRRVCRIEAGGRSVHAVFNGWGAEFSIPGMTALPDRATITYRDYGADVTLTVPLEAGASPTLKQVDEQALARGIEGLRKLEQEDGGSGRRELAIAYHYEQMASGFQVSDYVLELDRWLQQVNEAQRRMEHALELMADPGWKGWECRELAWESNWVTRMQDRAAATRAMETLRLRVRRRMVDLLADASRLAFKSWHGSAGRELLDRAQSIAGAVLGDAELGPEACRRIARGHHDLAIHELFVGGDIEAARHEEGQCNDWHARATDLQGQPRDDHPFHYEIDADFDTGG